MRSLKISRRKETVGMCLALEEMRTDSKREGIREGEIKGVVETCRNFNMTLPKTIQYISDHFAISIQQAEEEVKKYWK